MIVPESSGGNHLRVLAALDVVRNKTRDATVMALETENSFPRQTTAQLGRELRTLRAEIEELRTENVEAESILEDVQLLFSPVTGVGSQVKESDAAYGKHGNPVA